MIVDPTNKAYMGIVMVVIGAIVASVIFVISFKIKR